MLAKYPRVSPHFQARLQLGSDIRLIFFNRLWVGRDITSGLRQRRISEPDSASPIVVILEPLPELSGSQHQPGSLSCLSVGQFPKE